MTRPAAPDATVCGLGVFPVKSLGGLAVPAARLRPWGFDGDRRWMVVDPEGRFVTQRSTPAMALVHARPRPDGVVELATADSGPVALSPTADRVVVEVWRDTLEAVGGDPAADRWLSGVLDRPVRLVHLPRPGHDRPVDPDFGRPGDTVSFADGYPVLVTTTASLMALNEWQHAAGARVMTMDRFRPSVVVDVDEPWAEDRWAEIDVGEVRLRLVKPCSRCVMTAVVPETGTIERGGPLRQLGAHRTGVTFGVNAIPSTTGVVRVGDPVRVVATRPSPQLTAARD